MEEGTQSPGTGEEIRVYKIHVSTKYLELTRKKLELTRLPHEFLGKGGGGKGDWDGDGDGDGDGEVVGSLKGELEPLVDFWLDHYSWRIQETHLNTTLPQFRTAFKILNKSIPLRVHFLHFKSRDPNAVPLLLIPSFPFSNLSLRGEMLERLTDPDCDVGAQSFHVVVPCLPGLGFSDAWQGGEGVLRGTAGLFDGLMKRLGYKAYLCSGMGSGRESEGGIDYELVRLVGEEYRDSCLGVHLVEPCVEKPKIQSLEWWRWKVAGFLRVEIWGYDKVDFIALKESSTAARQRQAREYGISSSRTRSGASYGALGRLGLREPNTFSYALCDSPVGILSLLCSALRRRSPNHNLNSTEIIDMTELVWLPGPEAAMRYMAAGLQEIEALRKEKRTKSRVAVTVFGSDGASGEYIPPAWANTKHDVVFAQRAAGPAGITMWERSDVLVEGIRGLAKAIERLDRRLMVRSLEEVGVPFERTASDGENGYGMQSDAESPDTVVAVELS